MGNKIRTNATIEILDLNVISRSAELLSNAPVRHPDVNLTACARADQSGDTFRPSTPLIAPCFEVGLAALRQVQAPSHFERGSGSFETPSSPVFVFALWTAQIEPETPFPWFSRVRDPRALDDRADAHAGIVDVPRFGATLTRLRARAAMSR
jgi:hypothetical protein